MGEIGLKKAHELYQKGISGKKRCFKKAIKIYERLVKKGNIDAMYYYANMLYNGDGVKEDKQKAEEYYNKTLEYYKNEAKKENENVIEKLYNMISNKKISVTDEEKEKYYKMAISNKNQNATEKLNNVISNKDMTIDDKEKAIYYKIAVDNGNKDVIKDLYSMIISNKITDVTDKERLKYYKMAADLGNTDAMNNYAKMLYISDKIPNNKQEAVKYYKIAADLGNTDAMDNYADMLYDGDGILEDKEKAKKYYKMAADKGDEYAIEKLYNMISNKKISFIGEERTKYYKMAADLGNTNAMNNYANILVIGDKIPENKQEAIKYYKIAIDKGNVNAMKNYANMLAIGDGVPIDREEAAKYYKMAIYNGNIDFILNKIPDKQVFAKLFEEYGEKIIEILGENEEKYKIIKNKNGKIKSIEIKCVNKGVQGENQVTINRKINFNENGNLVNITDTAIHKDTGKKLYEVEYNEKGERLITYFDQENGIELITAIIDENGIIKFNFNNEIDLETLKQKTNEILNSFSNNESFDDILSYLKYAPLQLMEKEEEKEKIEEEEKEIEKGKIEFNTKCRYNLDNTLNIINSSFDRKNKDKIFICDFAYREHCVQLLICNGEVTIINTGLRFDDKTEKIDVITEIKTRFAEKFPEKAKQLKITESAAINQSVGNCVIASKLDAVEFLIKVKKHNQKYERLIEINNRIINIKKDIENNKKYDENEYQKLVEEKEKLSKNKDKMIFSSPKDINTKSKEELEEEIKIAQIEIIEQSKIPKYLNDIDLFAKGEEEFEELQEKHLILLRKIIKTALSVHENHLKHFNNVSKEMKNTISKMPKKKEISNEGMKKQLSVLKKTFKSVNKEFKKLKQQQSSARSIT